MFDTSTVLVPSTARSATTDSAGFLEHAALRARNLMASGSDGSGGDLGLMFAGLDALSPRVINV